MLWSCFIITNLKNFWRCWPGSRWRRKNTHCSRPMICPLPPRGLSVENGPRQSRGRLRRLASRPKGCHCPGHKGDSCNQSRLGTSNLPAGKSRQGQSLDQESHKSNFGLMEKNGITWLRQIGRFHYCRPFNRRGLKWRLTILRHGLYDERCGFCSVLFHRRLQESEPAIRRVGWVDRGKLSTHPFCLLRQECREICSNGEEILKSFKWQKMKRSLTDNRASEFMISQEAKLSRVSFNLSTDFRKSQNQVI